MRYFALFLMFASLTVFSIGCGQTDQPSAEPSAVDTADAGLDAGTPEPPTAETDGEAPADSEAPADGESEESGEESPSE